MANDDELTVSVPWPADLEWTPEAEQYLRARLDEALEQSMLATLPDSLRDLMCICQDRDAGHCAEGLDCDSCEVCQAESLMAAMGEEQAG